MIEKNVPKLRFPGFEGEWSRSKFADIATFSKGKGISKAEIDANGLTECVRYGELYTHYQETISEVKSRTSIPTKNLVLSEANDVIIPASGESQIDIATASCILRSGIALGGDLNIIKTNNDGVFLSYYLNYSKKQEIANLAQGISVVHLYATQLATLNLNLPSQDEQSKVADFVSTIDIKLNHLKKKKSLLEQYKKGMMQKIFNQEIRFKDDDGKDFGEWEEKTLDGFMAERNTQTPKSDEYPLMAFIANIGVTKKGDRYNREFLVNDEENKKYKRTEKGDFIYSSNNLETGSIGLNNFGSASISPVYSIFEISNRCNKEFLGMYLRSKEFINKMKKFRQGVVYGQWRIHESDFLQLTVNLPSVDEQTKIANFLLAIDDKINLVSEQIENCEVWKKGLLREMFV